MEALFTQALGLSDPWQVVGVDFQKSNGCIIFQVEDTAKRLPCPACGAPDQPIHDRLERSWEHLHFFQYKALIKAKIPRVGCTECGMTRQVEVPWARKGSGFSQVMEAFMVALCKEMPVLAVAELLHISDDRVWRVLDHYVEQARSQEDFSQVRRISADERSVRKGHHYLTMFCDAQKRGQVFDLLFFTMLLIVE